MKPRRAWHLAQDSIWEILLLLMSAKSKMSETFPSLLGFSNFDMLTPRSMTGLACNINFRINGRKCLKKNQIACEDWLNDNRHTYDPSSAWSESKKRVIRSNSFIGVQMIPSLFLNIPASRKHLHTTIGNFTRYC